jgi:hypothetical protein
MLTGVSALGLAAATVDGNWFQSMRRMLFCK